MLGLLALSHASRVSAVNFERGRQLYENHCQACHSDLLHTDKVRKVKTLTDLNQRVAAWAAHAGEDWRTAEVNDVTLYLDRTFYHFSDKVR